MRQGTRGWEATVGGQRPGPGLTPIHLDLAMDSEVEALIPDGVSAVLDCARLQLVAGGRGQPQGHVAVRGGHCGEEARVAAESPSQPSHPGPSSFHHWQPQKTQRTGLVRRQGPDLDIPSTASSLHPLKEPPTHPAYLCLSPPPWLALKLQNHCLPRPSTHRGPWRAGHEPAGHEW